MGAIQARDSGFFRARRMWWSVFSAKLQRRDHSNPRRRRFWGTSDFGCRRFRPSPRATRSPMPRNPPPPPHPAHGMRAISPTAAAGDGGGGDRPAGKKGSWPRPTGGKLGHAEGPNPTGAAYRDRKRGRMGGSNSAANTRLNNGAMAPPARHARHTY